MEVLAVAHGERGVVVHVQELVDVRVVVEVLRLLVVGERDTVLVAQVDRGPRLHRTHQVDVETHLRQRLQELVHVHRSIPSLVLGHVVPVDRGGRPYSSRSWSKSPTKRSPQCPLLVVGRPAGVDARQADGLHVLERVTEGARPRRRTRRRCRTPSCRGRRSSASPARRPRAGGRTGARRRTPRRWRSSRSTSGTRRAGSGARRSRRSGRRRRGDGSRGRCARTRARGWRWRCCRTVRPRRRGSSGAARSWPPR